MIIDYTTFNTGDTQIMITTASWWRAYHGEQRTTRQTKMEFTPSKGWMTEGYRRFLLETYDSGGAAAAGHQKWVGLARLLGVVGVMDMLRPLPGVDI